MIGSIDLDGVLCSFVPTFIREVNKLYNLSLTEQDVRDYDFRKLGLTSSQIYAAFDVMRLQQRYLSLPVIDGSQFAIAALAQSYPLAITTSRPTTLKDQTEQWVFQHFSGCFGMIHYGCVDKSEYLRKDDCSFHIDDCIDHIRPLEGKQTLPILYTQLYNLGCQTQFVYSHAITPSILGYHDVFGGWPSLRVHSWAECTAFLLSIQNK